MSVFNVNGQETDNLNDAIDLCKAVWHEYKAPAVLEQHRAALSKPSELDLQRARMGVSAPDISASSATKMLDARSAAAAKANDE